MPVKKKKSIRRKIVTQHSKTKKSSNKENLAIQDKTLQSSLYSSKNAKNLPRKISNNSKRNFIQRLYSPGKKVVINTGQTLANKNKMMFSHNTYRSTGLSRKDKSYVICRCQARSTRYLALKVLALNAGKYHKIFTVYGNCNAVRKALVERGWVEKIPENRMNLDKITKCTSLSKQEQQWELERLLLSNLVEKCPANFIWHSKDTVVVNSDHNTKGFEVIENKLMTDAVWTTKQGLCLSMKRNYWFYIEDVSEVSCPRTYNTYDDGEIDDFQRDYKITACSSLLKWVLEKVASDTPMFSQTGKISLNILIFALNKCREYLLRKQNIDIDTTLSIVKKEQWSSFFQKYYQIVTNHDIFRTEKQNKLPLYLGYARYLLEEMYKYRAQLSCEGCHNVWIIKPGHNSRGRGIRMASNLEVITNLINKAKSKFVIQKYIEEPLLIHETKFDIRQYYLVTSTYPLVIWMYKDCYLKFSSQKYSLKNYHESIHLTNNAVQRKYTNCSGRHEELPQNNMWHSDRYKSYLEKIGKGGVWDKIIYPSMKKSIIGIMLSSQDSLTLCKNRFELYGCDFVIDKLYKPWLIEINSGPDLNPTTSVTAKICPNVTADIIKVVIDYAKNQKCSTGKFECIYRQPMTQTKYPFAGDLNVQGYALPSSYFYKGTIPIRIPNEDEIFPLKKSDSYHTTRKKIKGCRDMDLLCEEEDNYSTVLSMKSEDMLDVITTSIKAKLEVLIQKAEDRDKNMSKALYNTQTPVAIVKSLPKLTNEKSEITYSLYSVPSSLSRSNSSIRLFKFSQLHDDPICKASTASLDEIEINIDKTKTEAQGTIQTKAFKTEVDYRGLYETQASSRSSIQEATSEYLNFVTLKEKEYYDQR